MYTIYDTAALTFLTPFFVEDDEEAVNLFRVAVTQCEVRSELYELILLGVWDPEMGNFNTTARQLIPTDFLIEA
jgi:hypothetical protein